MTDAHKNRSNSMPSVFRRLAVLAIAGIAPLSPCRGMPDTDGIIPPLVTTLEALDRLTILDQHRVVTLRIEGTVWWSGKAEGRVILQDDSAVLQLELDIPCQMPEMGDRFVLEGDCTAMKTRDFIGLSSVPVVENDGLHPPEEKSGSVHLTAGYHPVRVMWFNRTDRYGLSVDYAGPDLPRQPVPDAVLFHVPAESSAAATNVVNGLHYRCFEGQWWSRLPNFDHIAAANTGVVGNFDISVRNRDSHVGLDFSGFIQVLTEGDYTFFVQSDDGSRLFIGEPSLQGLIRGRGALPAQPSATMHGTDAQSLEYQWDEIEGTVTAFHRARGALEVDLIAGSNPIRLKVAEDSECSYTLRPQNRIRAVGVSRMILGIDGVMRPGEFFVQHWDDLEQRYITPNIWNEYPLMKIGSLMTMAASDIVDSVVHVSGKLESSGAGQPLVLDDGSGQLLVEEPVSNELARPSLEMLGLVGREGSDWVLRCAHYRQFGEAGLEPDGLPVLTTAEQVCQLSMEEAERGYPVRLRGVITSPNEYEGAIFQDASRGIYLWLTKPENMAQEEWKPIAVQTGDYCEIEGVTAPFAFNPYIRVSRLGKLGAGSLPDPARPTWDQLINGTMQCNYVEMEGVVASIQDDTIGLLTRDGRINLRLNPAGPDIPRDALGATVRLRGALLADWDGESRRVVVGSIYLDQHSVTVVHPAPIDPFAMPLKGVGDLLQFDPQGGALQRVKVSGVLIHKDAPMCSLMDGENGLRFLPVEQFAAEVGDAVEVVGFPDLNGPSPLLREAVVRGLGAARLPEPRTLVAGDLLRDAYDATRVTIQGVLLSSKSTPDELVLELQAGVQRFIATVKHAESLESGLTPGSQLAVTGVYVGQGGNHVLGLPIDSFRLLLNTGSDIEVLSRPPWWTLKRLLIVLGVLAGILVAALVWINLLHRKVEDRTRQLGDQIRQRQRIERQQEIEQVRARLAHNLHDDLGSGLTEVNMLASLVKSPATSAEEKARYADQLSELALHMVTSLDEIVWAENPINDTVGSLAGYFGSYAQRLLELAAVSCGLDVAENLPDQPMDPHFRQELFLAFKEALTNVIQHANASKVWVRIAIQDDALVVIVSDDGCGILPDKREPGADGLLNMQQRLSAIGGHCDIRSDPGSGTTVRFQAPIRKGL